ncbi:MAG: L-asparaginase 2 [Gemmatimonadetes bacterium]|nr:asparaginase [Gemmatimonadota bacterium]NIQ54480.1 asparaginase [Gemmatimonadota bacterium]NIU74693.1 L-asparaginase 2 [Gammaproteobacteria bacterium]NIX44611.1 L-asparaginase 2 [Gemmatimonadota bacterium]NIY08834.1 L-asparaginase 2 [Gemmatimonadota bacterium]
MTKPGGGHSARVLPAALTLGALALVGACAAGGPAPRTGTPAVPDAADAPARTLADTTRPRVHLIATGGTISNTEDDGRLTGEEIVARVPGLDGVAAITVEQYTNIASGSMTPDLWLGLARRVVAALRSDPRPAGVVVTHGTDTMEETAYFLELALGEDRPVALTGAMRNNSMLSSDGPANLYNAVRLLVHPEARGRGVMVVMNDVALPAREATKLNTSRVEAFHAGKRGPVAVLDPDTVVLLEPARPRDPPLLDPETTDALPRVDIVYSYAGADGSLVDAAVEAGAAGVVVAAVGRGGMTPGQAEAVDRALERGVYVAVSSRTMTGRVPVGSDERRLEDWRPGTGVRFGAGDLTPQKARILLMLGLAATDDPAAVLALFRRY